MVKEVWGIKRDTVLYLFWRISRRGNFLIDFN